MPSFPPLRQISLVLQIAGSSPPLCRTWPTPRHTISDPLILAIWISFGTLRSWFSGHTWQLWRNLFELCYLSSLPLFCLAHRENLSMEGELWMTRRRRRSLLQGWGRGGWRSGGSALLRFSGFVFPFILFISTSTLLLLLFFFSLQSLFLFPFFSYFLDFCIT